MKKLLKLALTLMMVLSMAACSTPSDEDANNTLTDNESVSFTIWHTFTKDQEKLLNDLADEFEAANEGVTIEVVGGYDPKTFDGAVSDAVSNGVGPQLIFQYASLAVNFDGYDLLLPFEDYWDYKLSDITSANYIDEATSFSDGKVYAVPIQTTGPLLFYNKTIYDELGLTEPRTWEQLKENCKKIHDEKGIVGFAVDDGADLAQIFILQAYDGGYVDLENNKVIWNGPEFTKWVEYWAEGVQEGYFQVTAQSADGYNSGDLNSKVLASYIGSSAGLPYLNGKPGSADESWELAVTTVPVTDENSKEVVSWNRSAIGFKTDNEATNQAIADFVSYFVQEDARWCKTLNAYTPYYAVQEDADYQAFVAEDMALVALGKQIENGIVTPTYPGSVEARSELKALMKGVLNDNWDAATAVNTAATNCEAAMNE